MALRTGKLPPELLTELLRLHGAPDEAVHVGPAVGEDAAAVDMGTAYLVQTTDPVTLAREALGQYAVHVNANDLATMGARPRWFQAVLLLPEGSTAEDARRVFADVHEACQALGVAVTGGHAETTPAVRQPVLVGAMQGLAPKDGLVTTAGAREGDVLLLTKTAGIEGTAVLARERGETVQEDLGEDLLGRAARFLEDPGISIVREALLAAEHGATSLHDPTEGGVAMGLYEVSHACGHIVEVDVNAIPVARETLALCEVFDLNPLRLLASGALVVAVPTRRQKALLGAYERSGVRATLIGRVGGSGVGVRVQRAKAPTWLEPTEQDELARLGPP